ncbi:hypothetical protein WS84_27785 [Burkholderia anthina]|uniref:Txe/YoeB family addiction module toxin n=1 Tax=Burkholderia anthina TaxID=179879 RepID=UPI0007529DDB|nr:Txe/YoeB family addiction module toxin [Burkholderia anthina]KVH05340.1 hypothetical protein WS84_27785 [Burkholderia anthina]
MARGVRFAPNAWDDFLAWAEDPDTFGRIASLINECRREPFKGIGKPEALKHDQRGLWSRRITEKHRLVYGVTASDILVMRCKGHYDDK